jgi:SNF2 family DNA or RNA helicase
MTAMQEAQEVMSLRQQWENYYRASNADKHWAPFAKDYQWDGAMFLAAAKRGILGDEMGLGKSLTSLMALDMIEAKKIVLIAQAEICEQFAGEVMQWAPHRTVVNLAKKTSAQRNALLDELHTKDEFVAVINFEMMRESGRRTREPSYDLALMQPDTVIIDEAHNIKSTKSATFKAIQRFIFVLNTCPRCGAQYMQGEGQPPCQSCGWSKGQPSAVLDGAIASPMDLLLQGTSVKNLILTTGTPILNEPGDLWPLLHLCNPITFKRLSHFYSIYCVNNYFTQKWEFKKGGMSALALLIAGNYLARTKADAGIVLPEQKVHVVPIALDEEKYPKQYNAITGLSEAAQILLDSGEAMTVFDTMSLLTRKRQANVWPGGIQIKDKEGRVLLDVGAEIRESVKIDRVIDNILTNLPRRQVVFSQFKTALAEMQTQLEQQGVRVVRLDGDTPNNLRSEIKRDFYRGHGEGKWDVLLTHYKSGGTGLNLTAATVSHVLDEEWNPGKRDQAYARTNRMGQSEVNDVYVYRIEKTVDTWLAATIARKEQIVKGFDEAFQPEEINADSLREAMASGQML